MLLNVHKVTVFSFFLADLPAVGDQRLTESLYPSSFIFVFIYIYIYIVADGEGFGSFYVKFNLVLC